MKKRIFVSCLSLVSMYSFAANGPIKLSEKLIHEFARKENPTLDSIEAQFLQKKSALAQTNTDYAVRLDAGGTYAETKEKALFSFAPIFSPTRTVYSKLTKSNFASGTSMTLGVSNDQRSATNGLITKANTTTLELGVSIDLWKNFFGKLSKAKVESASLSFEQAKIEKEISIKTFELSLRKIYWGLVANQESLNITTKLMKQAQEQAKDAKKRLANSVADKSEVARYESQVASRKSNMIYLEYQRESMLKQLKELIPELSGKEIELSQYNLGNTIVKVLECTSVIGSHPQVPLEYTKYDDISKLLQKIQSKQSMLAGSFDQMDVSLNAGYKVTGVDSPNSGEGSLSGSVDDFQDHDRGGYSVGLNVSVPFGDSYEKLRTTQELIANKRYQAEMDKLISQMNATHQQLRKSINLLTEVIKTQRFNSQKLNERLSEMQKKYNQARISVNDLINDQDALLNSDLTIIQTQLEVVYTLFDYLVVFSETPCEFNRI